MKIKNVNLKWYAFRYNWNDHKLEFTNVLNGWEENIAKVIKKGAKNKWEPVVDYESFKNWLRKEFVYYYWSKSEHEVMIGDLCENDLDAYEKHDIWWQLEPNLDRICEYIINEMQIKFRKEK